MKHHHVELDAEKKPTRVVIAMTSHNPLLAVLLLGLVLTSGCGETSGYQYAPVSGIVVLDGKPLADAFVTFQPRGGVSSTAITDSDGKYSLTTIDGDLGAVVGTHQVSIYSVHGQKSGASDDAPKNVPKERVPEQYNYRTTLTFEVSPEGTKEADWKLEDRQ